MKNHKQIRESLYEYVQNTLSPEELTRVGEHLQHCDACRSELAEVQAALRFLASIPDSPSEQQSPEYWNAFARAVEERARSASHHSRVRISMWDAILSFLIFDRKLVFGAAGAMAIVLAAVFFWPGKQEPGPPSEIVESGTSQHQQEVIQANERLSQYFRKSKILFVGLANMRTDAGQPIDLTSERKASRDLIHEARFLKNQNLDLRSAKLIDDMNKILIELANMEAEADLPNVELIRGGIHQENLLFKIRMAETMSDTSAQNASQTTFQ